VRDKVLQAGRARWPIDIPEALSRKEYGAPPPQPDPTWLEEQGAHGRAYRDGEGVTQDQLIADVRLEATKAVKADLALLAVVAAESDRLRSTPRSRPKSPWLV